MVLQPPSCFGTSQRPEERKQRSGGLLNGPRLVLACILLQWWCPGRWIVGMLIEGFCCCDLIVVQCSLRISQPLVRLSISVSTKWPSGWDRSSKLSVGMFTGVLECIRICCR